MTESPKPSVSNAQNQTQDEKVEKAERAILMQIQEINTHVAQYRDQLLSIGRPRDCPELREKIRRTRRNCVEMCKNTSQLLLPQVGKTTEIGIPVDCPNLMLLFYVSQLFLRELSKSEQLIRHVPMDMSEYESRNGPSKIGNVISQILLCKQITPNFYVEELCSIRKDSDEMRELIAELQEFMPQSDENIEKYQALHQSGNRGNRGNGRRIQRNRLNHSNDRSNRSVRRSSYLHEALNLFCCTARTSYV
ncbi:uncharacterized protein LOC114870905 [Osmia bicornis bicornis]|uniref:uncharacterized protein LOC114870905 n=1 Tax=Osmia bicornis bicornis TaxID=1437191 RepID=UPI0010F829AA|nr:uncharacterized protein LOC114870905 [Osmia bicornis bicornis]XP_029031960.1 uncharacterized protein LOC114870905 [Osmia bicornis bicornis]XP_046141850.1 uncharacterized protein LOC114870905 [Osmia bicornis bicornis]